MSLQFRRSRRRPTALAAGLLAVALIVTACGSDGDSTSDPTSTPTDTSTDAPAGEPREGGDLVWAIETSLTTINPHRNGQDKATPILRNLYSTYLYRDGDGTYHPWLAESFDESDDGTTVVINLREGVTFSDGEALDADAVVANFDKINTEGYLTSSPGGLKFVDNYEKTGDLQVTFTLSQPDILFLIYLSSNSSAPLSPASLEVAQDVLEVGGPQVHGVGPFTVDTFTQNTELKLVKRADYAWGPEAISGDQTAAYLDSVTYRTLPEGATRTGALEQRQVQISSDIQPLDVSVFEDDPAFTYQRHHVSGLPYSLYFNVSKAPLDDIRVRQAFTKGVDIDAIVNSIYQGAFDRARLPISVVGPFADASLNDVLDTDIDEANRLLDEAGWTERNSDGIRVKDGETLTIRAVSGAPFVRESRDQLNIAIGAALRQNVGIDYQFQIEDLGTESERSAANDYEVFDNSYGGPDPVAGLDLLYYSSDPARGYIARGRFNDSTLEKFIDDARFTTDQQVRAAAYNELQKYVLADQSYVLPLYQTQDNLAWTDSVNGVTIDPSNGQPFGAYTIWLSE